MIRSVAVTAANGGAAPGSVQMGKTIRLYAQATRNNGSKDILSSGVTWASSDQTKAKIGGDGTVTPAAVGSTKITAKADGVTSPALTVTVTAAA
ncbi:Ig-like domain-containing protein [Bifidobacterium sp. SO1]|uniref:Ig-like domain-containing protein n=1 Tax=Bifidobacterium sp. SO1 TaxID=2809029 RepID=UPI001BDBF732|nr:Ig-like domain-containing protein [Bifidobacterium sp. SO1]MBT1161207.1 Ig-like domain-containing protein [Bifidobacterium sp. SO1]